MLYSILAVGDVVGESGLAHLERHLRPLQKLKNISFTVVNGENISGVGLTCKQAWRVYDAGADAVTLGNHTFGKMEIGRMLDETPWLLRPANLSGRMPGHGCAIFDLNGLRFRVISLIGRCTLQWNSENPFTLADRLLEQGSADFTWWTFTRRPPVKSWPWDTIWTAGPAPSGAPTPMCPPPTNGSTPTAPATSRTWA